MLNSAVNLLEQVMTALKAEIEAKSARLLLSSSAESGSQPNNPIISELLQKGFVYILKESTDPILKMMIKSYQGDVISQFNLGISFETGEHEIGVNFTSARLQFELAGQQMSRLAQEYDSGSLTNGYNLLNLAAFDFSIRANWRLVEYYKQGKGGLTLNNLKANELFRETMLQKSKLFGIIFSPEDVLDEEVLDLVIKSIGGDANAQFDLSQRFKNGTQGLKRNETMAQTLFDFSKRLAFAEDEVRIGTVFLSGIHLPENHREAYHYYIDGAIHGSVNALYLLGVCSEYGVGTVRSISRAIDYYRQADSWSELLAPGLQIQLKEKKIKFPEILQQPVVSFPTTSAPTSQLVVAKPSVAPLRAESLRPLQLLAKVANTRRKLRVHASPPQPAITPMLLRLRKQSAKKPATVQPAKKGKKKKGLRI